MSRLSHKNVVVFSSLCCPVASRTIIKGLTFTSNGKRHFLPCSQVFPYFSLTCLLFMTLTKLVVSRQFYP